MDVPTIVIVAVAGVTIGAGAIGLIARYLLKKQATMQQNLPQELQNVFKALSGDALENNNRIFLALAEQNLKTLHSKADASLQQREQSVQNLVRPIREALEKTEQQIREIEKERKGAFGSIAKQLELTADAQNKLREETQHLTQALKQPQVRGRWGELTLHRLAELAGMVEYCDFDEQVHISTDDGHSLRPDVIVHMPNKRIVVIDAKTPLSAYLEAFETQQEDEQKTLLKKHAQNIYARVKDLSAKSYAQQFQHALDFIVLFLPADQFLSAALKYEPDLIDQALQKEVILATPASLIALLRVIAFGWREKSLAENAQEIQRLSEELCDRFRVFSEHLEAVGKGINNSVQNYNNAVRSFESRLMPSARKLNELGIDKAKDIKGLHQIETQAANPSLPDDRPDDHYG